MSQLLEYQRSRASFMIIQYASTDAAILVDSDDRAIFSVFLSFNFEQLLTDKISSHPVVSREHPVSPRYMLLAFFARLV